MLFKYLIPGEFLSADRQRGSLQRRASTRVQRLQEKSSDVTPAWTSRHWESRFLLSSHVSVRPSYSCDLNIRQGQYRDLGYREVRSNFQGGGKNHKIYKQNQNSEALIPIFRWISRPPTPWPPSRRPSTGLCSGLIRKIRGCGQSWTFDHFISKIMYAIVPYNINTLLNRFNVIESAPYSLTINFLLLF